MLSLSVMAFIAAAVFGILTGREFFKETKSWGSFILWLLFFFAFIALGIYDIVQKDQASLNARKEDKKEVIDSTYSIGKNNTQKVKDAVDSTRQAILDSIKKSREIILSHGDSNTAVIIKTGAKNKEEIPRLDVVVLKNKNNPYIQGGDKFIKFNAIIGSADGKIIMNIRHSFVIVNNTRRQMKITGVENKGFSNASSMVYNNIGDSLSITINPDVPLRLTEDSLYIYFRVQYSNKTGKQQPPLRKIYRITKYDLDGRQLEEPIRSKFEEIKTFIYKNGLW